jgi:hypothetical protein
MENLTRYKLKVRYGEEDGFYAVGVVRQEGEWVKFSDVKELLQTATNQQTKHAMRKTLLLQLR